MPEHAPSTVVAHYLSALAASDLERARGLLADDFTFRGPGMARAVDRGPTSPSSAPSTTT
jgi:ketosteroid isomerase-like protein